jgi:hypothetical protein
MNTGNGLLNYCYQIGLMKWTVKNNGISRKAKSVKT